MIDDIIDAPTNQTTQQTLPGVVDRQPIAIPLGDINGDGHADFIASIQDEIGDFSQIFFDPSFHLGIDDPVNFVPKSEATIVFGGTDLLNSQRVTLRLPAPLAVSSTFGSRSATSTPGDYNGDGIDDIAIAVFREMPAQSGQLFGAIANFESHGVYIVYGKATGWASRSWT